MPLTPEIENLLVTKKVSYFCLDNAGIFDSDIDKLCSLLSENSHIVYLSLEQNNITDQGARKLAERLPANITGLNLAKNSFSDEFLTFLTTADTPMIPKRITEITKRILGKDKTHLYHFFI